MSKVLQTLLAGLRSHLPLSSAGEVPPPKEAPFRYIPPSKEEVFCQLLHNWRIRAERAILRKWSEVPDETRKKAVRFGQCVLRDTMRNWGAVKKKTPPGWRRSSLYGEYWCLGGLTSLGIVPNREGSTPSIPDVYVFGEEGETKVFVCVYTTPLWDGRRDVDVHLCLPDERYPCLTQWLS